MDSSHTVPTTTEVFLSPVITAKDISNGAGFSARQFRREGFDGLMEPFIMVDDYTMTEPTFGAHPHAGIAAISVLFEETEGLFYNHDSLDNHLALRAGDLYWLNAGRGAMHDESPISGQAARIRGLQMFLKLPADASQSPPSASHIPAADIPCFTSEGVRVRVVSGDTNGVEGYENAVAPATILDGNLGGGARFTHSLNASASALIYVISGEVVVSIGSSTQTMLSGQAVALNTSNQIEELTLRGVRNSHFVLVSAPLLTEKFVNRGPFALENDQQIEQAQAAAQKGLMGYVEKKAVTNL